MPIFDYECKNCGHALIDVFQRINEEPLVYCPECNESQLTKRMGASNFILRGDGWYKPSAKDESE